MRIVRIFLGIGLILCFVGMCLRFVVASQGHSNEREEEQKSTTPTKDDRTSLIIDTHEDDTVVLTIDQDVYERGKDIFKKNCRCCHDFDRYVGGPQLVYRDDYEFVFHKRRPDYSFWYIMDSDSLAASGDEWAIKMKKDYPMNRMMSFKNSLSKQEVRDVVEYINYKSRIKNCIH